MTQTIERPTRETLTVGSRVRWTGLDGARYEGEVRGLSDEHILTTRGRVPWNVEGLELVEETALARPDAVHTPEVIEPLTPQDREILARLEEQIQKDMHAFLRVGEALAFIRDHRLYRETHATFEAYVTDRLSLSRRRADQLIQAAGTFSALAAPQNENHGSQIVHARDAPGAAAGALPDVSERALRPLGGLEPGDQRQAWDRAQELAAGGPVTSRHTEQAAEEIQRAAASRDLPPPEPNRHGIYDPDDPRVETLEGRIGASFATVHVLETPKGWVAGVNTQLEGGCLHGRQHGMETIYHPDRASALIAALIPLVRHLRPVAEDWTKIGCATQKNGKHARHLLDWAHGALHSLPGGFEALEALEALNAPIATGDGQPPRALTGNAVWWRDAETQRVRTGEVQEWKGTYWVVEVTDAGRPQIACLTDDRLQVGEPPEPANPYGDCTGCGEILQQKPFRFYTAQGEHRLCAGCEQRRRTDQTARFEAEKTERENEQLAAAAARDQLLDQARARFEAKPALDARDLALLAVPHLCQCEEDDAEVVLTELGLDLEPYRRWSRQLGSDLPDLLDYLVTVDMETLRRLAMRCALRDDEWAAWYISAPEEAEPANAPEIAPETGHEDPLPPADCELPTAPAGPPGATVATEIARIEREVYKLREAARVATYRRLQREGIPPNQRTRAQSERAAAILEEETWKRSQIADLEAKLARLRPQAGGAS